MKTPNLYFHVYLAALLMLAAFPTEAADVKELFAIDLADYPGAVLRAAAVAVAVGDAAAAEGVASGEGATGEPRADHRRRADLRDPLADPAPA